MKRLISLILVVMMVFSLVACTSSKAPTPTASSSPSASTQPTPNNNTEQKPVRDPKAFAGQTINVLCSSTNFAAYYQDNLQKFTNDTGINVNYEVLSNDQLNSKILVNMAAGGKDIDATMFAAYQNTKMYVRNGWLVPLEQYIDDEFKIDDYMSGCLDMCKVDGIIYGIPHGSEFTNLTYNKTMLNEAGVDASKIKTWDDLIAACVQIEQKLPGIKGMAMRGSGHAVVAVIIPLVRSFGGDYFDANGNAALTSDAWVKSVQIYKELMEHAQEGVNSANWSESANAFAQKQAAIRMDANSQYTYLIDPKSSLVKDDEIGFLSLPSGPAGTYTTIGNWAIGISYGSQKKDVAWEFIRYFENPETSLERQLVIGKNPPRVSTANSPELAKVYPAGYLENTIEISATATGAALPNMIYAAEARTALGEALDNIFLGGDIMKNLKAANDVMQELLDQEAAEASGK